MVPDSRDVCHALQEYREYVSQFTEATGGGSSFTFLDNDGRPCTVQSSGDGILQVRVPPFD